MITRKRISLCAIKGTILALGSAMLFGCASAPQAVEDKSFELTLLHIGDHHSTLAPQAQTLSWEGQQWQIEAGGFPRVGAQIKALRAANENVLTLHAGDALTGGLYFSLFGSEPDARFMNAVCFDAFTIGNHEFDTGDAGLAEFLKQLGTERCPTAKLGANIKPEVGVSPLTPESQWQSFKPYTLFERGGETLAVIGVVVAERTKKSSKPDTETQFLDELETIKKYITEVQRQGVEKIVLLTHVQYQKDRALIQQLPGVDIVIGGDSHSLLGDFSAFGIESAGPYPTQLTNADGDPVCIGHAYKYSLVVGEMHATFDGDKISHCGGRPHYLLGEDIQVQDGMVTTYEPIKAALSNSNSFSVVTPNPALERMLTPYEEKAQQFANAVVARVPETICHQQVHQTPRAGCSSSVSSGLHRVIAEAFLNSVPEADFSLQNGAGVRGDIQAGNFTAGEAYNVLPYANTLVKLELSGAELRQAMEEALAYALSEDGSMGAYPYGAGIRYSIDLTEDVGSRVSHLEVWDKGSQSWQPMSARATYIMVTNSYIAGGQDGWETFYRVSERGRSRDTGIDYAQSLIDFAKAQQVLKRPSNFATQSYTPQEGK